MLKTKPLINTSGEKVHLYTKSIMLICVKSRNIAFRKIIYVLSKQFFIGIENMCIFLAGENGIPAH